ncbi:MAG: hypothetical protein M5U34_07440 [Chloroflexi bacterium]|nr:hypothetical protein [Chloroflexota bacterium]
MGLLQKNRRTSQIVRPYHFLKIERKNYNTGNLMGRKTAVPTKKYLSKEVELLNRAN